MMKVIMLGTGSPRLNKDRIPSAHLLLAGDLPILVDCAEGTTMQLVKSDIPPQDVKHVFFTHLHADHMLGYANFLISGWVEGRRELTVVGPVGTKRMHNLLIEMLEKDIEYRLSLGRPTTGILDVNVIELEQPGQVDINIPIEVHSAEMVHNVETFAYRFDKDNQSVVFSGDTAPPTTALAELSKDANMLIHDCCLTLIKDDNVPNAKDLWINLQKEHCTPTQAAETAKKANVQQLVLTHFLPKMNPISVHQEASKVFAGEIVIPNDLDVLEV